ncbi:MAG: HAMP domain-containing histidine kinase [Anaerolineales bacterium]|nr:HAMP domain-containing histidine kinase [Anaerolineales bacterium]
MLAILDSPLGGIFYSLLCLLLASAASLWLYSRAAVRPARMRNGLILLMAAHLLALLVHGLAWWGLPLAQAASAPLQRGMLALALVAVAMLWQPADAAAPRRSFLFGLQIFGVLIFTGLILLLWLPVPAGSSFNYTDSDYAWSAASGLLALLGLFQIARATSAPGRRRGLLHMALLLLAQVAHVFLAEPYGNLPLLVQTGALLALPLLFTLPSTPAIPAEVDPEAEDSADAPNELLELLNEDAAALDEPEEEWQTAEELEEELPGYFDLSPHSESEPHDPLYDDSYDAEPPAATPAFVAQNDMPEPSPVVELNPADELAAELAEQLGAEICVLATYNDAQLQLEFEYGYNVLRSAAVAPLRLALHEVPRIASALQRRRSLRLQTEDAPQELTALSQALRLSFPANLLLVPFAYPQDLRQWAVLALHTDAGWQAGDELLLEQRAQTLGAQLASALGVVDRPTVATPFTQELEQTRAELESVQAENARYRADVERLLAHIDTLQDPHAADAAHSTADQPWSTLLHENQRLKQSLAELQAPAASPATTPPATPSEVSAEQAKEELRLALEEVAALQARLETAQQAIVDTVQQQPGAQIPAEQVELVTSIAQELRQPLSSVMGYTDLLLGESVGLLGALQRKFLERVRSSTERMNLLIDNLIRVAALDPEGASVPRSLVDLGSVIDDAIRLLRQPLQEKQIALRVDLPRQLPALNTDRDALQQVLYHLLQNADAATPAGGAISLRAAQQTQADLGEYILVQVSDSGGGIPEEALPRVFSRVYRAQNPVIPGVGDSGVGLTIAETLTKALGGRIWVESQPGAGATFSVLLPLAPAA